MLTNKKSSLTKNHYGYIFLLPFIIIFITFVAYPILNTFYLSITDARIRPGSWGGDIVGFDNFTLLLNDPMFRMSILNTWRLWLFNFIPQMILALALAVMFTSTTFRLRGTGFFKASYYFPNLLMPVTVGALFYSLLDIHGPANQFLVGMTGILPEARNFLNIVTDTRVVVIFLQTWLWFGQTAIVLVAGMTSISPTLYESAVVDGANQFKMFFLITLPLLKPIMLFVLITSLVGGLQMFDVPHLLAGQFGNPDNSVLTVNMFMNLRRQGPGFMIGQSAAVSVVLFFMSSFIALILFNVFAEPTDEVITKRLARKRRRRGAQ